MPACTRIAGNFLGVLVSAGPARLPGFHTSVGGGGERQMPEWYAEKGITYKLNTKVRNASPMEWV